MGSSEDPGADADRSLAEAIHSGPVQRLAAARWQLEAVVSDTMAPELRSTLTQVAALVVDAQSQLRRLMIRLDPGVRPESFLADLGDLVCDLLDGASCTIGGEVPPRLSPRAANVAARVVCTLVEELRPLVPSAVSIETTIDERDRSTGPHLVLAVRTAAGRVGPGRPVPNLAATRAAVEAAGGQTEVNLTGTASIVCRLPLDSAGGHVA